MMLNLQVVDMDSRWVPSVKAEEMSARAGATLPFGSSARVSIKVTHAVISGENDASMLSPVSACARVLDSMVQVVRTSDQLRTVVSGCVQMGSRSPRSGYPTRYTISDCTSQSTRATVDGDKDELRCHVLVAP